MVKFKIAICSLFCGASVYAQGSGKIRVNQVGYYPAGSKLAVLIENKVRAGESKTQLRRYEAIVAKEFAGKNYSVLKIFLTPNGELPKGSDSYLIASHQIVLEILENVTGVYGRRIPDRELQFIGDYMTVLREELAMDQELVELCRKIYSEHREAIDLINEHGNYDKDIEAAGARFLHEHNERLQKTFINARRVWFVPNEFRDLPRLGDGKWNGDTHQFIAMFFATYGDDKLKIVLEVGPFQNPQSRVHFLQYLNQHGFPMSEKAMAPERSYKRLYTAVETIADWNDEDQVHEAMNKLFNSKKAQDAIKKLKDATDSFKWEAIA